MVLTGVSRDAARHGERDRSETAGRQVGGGAERLKKSDGQEEDV